MPGDDHRRDLCVVGLGLAAGVGGAVYVLAGLLSGLLGWSLSWRSPVLSVAAGAGAVAAVLVLATVDGWRCGDADEDDWSRGWKR
jgi:hypothetical protein